MKNESYVLLFVGFFFGCVGLAYWFLSYEDAGSVMLFGTFLLGVCRASTTSGGLAAHEATAGGRPERLRRGRRRSHRRLPREQHLALRPRLGATFVGLALVFGAWTLGVGLFLAVAALVGVIYESRRGGLV